MANNYMRAKSRLAKLSRARGFTGYARTRIREDGLQVLNHVDLLYWQLFHSTLRAPQGQHVKFGGKVAA